MTAKLFITIGNMEIIKRGLMINTGRLDREIYDFYSHVADNLVDRFLNHAPINDPESCVWDNRRKPK